MPHHMMPRAAIELSQAQPHPQKPNANHLPQPKKNQKSRNGCLTCKKKRLKCDETKPACTNCISKKIECGGYSTNFKWKSFEETTTSQKVLGKPPKQPLQSSFITVISETGSAAPPSRRSSRKDKIKATEPAAPMMRSHSMSESAPIDPQFQQALQQAALSIAGRSPEELAKQSELMAQGKNPYGKLGPSRRGSEVAKTPEVSVGEDYIVKKVGQKKRISDSQIHEPPTSQEMSYSHSLPTFDTHQPAKRRQTTSVLDQPVLSPGSNGGSPSFSTLVRAFTEFESINVPQTPSAIDPLSPMPRILEISRGDASAVADDQEDATPALDESGLIMSHFPKRSLSMDSALSASSIPQYRRELLSFSKSIGSPQLSIHPSFGTDSPFPLAIPQSLASYTDFDVVYQAFDKYICAVMSIKNGPTENPWRTLMWPLALQHSVLYKALAAMALFHAIKHSGESMSKLAMTYMRQSMSELAEGLVNETIPNEVALATCLALAVAHSWEKTTTTGVAHLKGARSIINKLTREEIRKKEPLYKFLINLFLYYDVLTRVSSMKVAVDADYEENGKLLQNLKRLSAPTDEDKSATGTTTSPTDLGSHKSASSVHSSPNFNELFDSSIFPSKDNELHEDESMIDPLLGCAPGLFLIIGRVASFIAKVRTMSKLSLGTISTAAQLKNDLISWKPNANIRNTLKPEDPDCDISSCITTAESYRFSTLLYLQQAVPEVASQSSSDLAEKVLMLIASIPTSSKTCLLHMFPMLIASCEVTTEDDRSWVKNRWRSLSEQIALGTVGHSMEIIEEVWRRRDILAKRGKGDGDGTSPTWGGADSGPAWDLIQDRIDALTSNKKRDEQGINSWAHWTTVMKEWDWEVLFG